MTPGTREHHDGRYKEQLCPWVLHNILCRHSHRHCCYGSTHLNIRGNPSKRFSRGGTSRLFSLRARLQDLHPVIQARRMVPVVPARRMVHNGTNRHNLDT